jgi:hypothetical protein
MIDANYVKSFPSISVAEFNEACKSFQNAFAEASSTGEWDEVLLKKAEVLSKLSNVRSTN